MKEVATCVAWQVWASSHPVDSAANAGRGLSPSAEELERELVCAERNLRSVRMTRPTARMEHFKDAKAVPRKL